MTNTYTPVDYDYINLYNAERSPSTVHSLNSALTRFFQRQLLNRIISVFKFEGLPEDWNYDYFINVLLVAGFVGVVETDKYGVIPQHCSLYGRDVFYQPTNIVVSNPLIKGILRPRIGEECALIKLQPDYRGVWGKVSFYADALALTAEAAGLNILNSKLAYVFASSNKAGAETFKKMLDQINAGNPAVFVDKDLMGEDGRTPQWIAFAQNLGQNYIAGQLLKDYQSWLSMFDAEVGIPNVGYEKAERLITDEVNGNNADTSAQVTVWLESIRRGLDMVRKVFDLDISVDLRYNYENNDGDTDLSDEDYDDEPEEEEVDEDV